jgi:hypothetical protein
MHLHPSRLYLPRSSPPYSSFCAYVSRQSVAFALGQKPDQLLAWLRVTHVCHQWCKIALNHPLFWSHVDFTKFGSAGAAEILPYTWRQGFPAVTGTMLSLVHSKKNSRIASPTYATLPLGQNPSILTGHSKDSYHRDLLPLSNTFGCPVMKNPEPEHHGKYLSLTLFLTAPPQGSLASSCGSATSAGIHHS